MTRSSRVAAGAVAFAVIAGAARFGYRLLPKEHVTSHEGHSTCGSLRYRSQSITRQGYFESTARIESEATLENAEGAVIATNVQLTACTYLPARAAFIAGDAPVVTIVNGERIAGRIPLPFVPTTLTWSKDGRTLAALAKGKAALVTTGPSFAATILSEDENVSPVGAAWSPTGRFCFVTSVPAVNDDGVADLFCTADDGGAVSKRAHATWAGRDVQPWAGYHLDTPVLCGDELRPKNVDCIGLTRGDL